MEKIGINVGIIDDDETKRTQIIAALQDCVDEAADEIKVQYQDYELIPIEMEIPSNIDDIIDEIKEQDVDALLIDYQLTSFEPTVDYTGVGIAKRADKKYLGFPVFVLTSFESDLYKHEVFDAYKVFDFERYMTEPKERVELNKKIIEQVLKRKKEIENKKSELNSLLHLKESNSKISDRILELDDFIERSIDGDNSISMKEKERLLDNRLDEMLSILRKVVEAHQ
jgi:CheY-like chemotaxis protein